MYIHVPYTHNSVTEMRGYKVRSRPALDAVKHVLEDPALRGSLICHPEKRYVRKPGTDVNMRVWSDVHTADDWWKLQVFIGIIILFVLTVLYYSTKNKLPHDRIILNISLYCDGTQLNSFGTKKACGVYLWINNFPREIRLSRTKKGGAILVGTIPEVCLRRL